MTPIAEIAFHLNSGGIPPDRIARIMELIEAYARERVEHSTRIPPEFHPNSGGTHERRKAWDRDYRRRLKLKNSGGIPPDRASEHPSPLLTTLPSSQLEKGKEEVVTRARAGTRLASDWAPSAGDLEYGEKLGLDRAQIDGMAEDMRLWAESNSNRPIARKADWSKTFKGWMRREQQKLKGAGNGKYRRSGERVSPIQAALDRHRENIDRAIEEEREVRERAARLLQDRRGQQS